MKEMASTLVSDSFTFEKQSAYLVYKNAKAILPYRTDITTTGPFYTSLTIAYQTQSLSTYHNCNPTPKYLEVWPYDQINFEDFNRPPRWSVVSTQRPCHLSSIPGDSLQNQVFPPTDVATQYTDYYNKPLVLLPAPLTDVDPAWATCSMGDTGIGLYDPPRAIIPAEAMVAPATMTPAVKATALAQEGAQPASTVSDGAPAQTSVVITLPNGDRIVDFVPAKTAKANGKSYSDEHESEQSSNDKDDGSTSPPGDNFIPTSSGSRIGGSQSNSVNDENSNGNEGSISRPAADLPPSGDSHVESSPQASSLEPVIVGSSFNSSNDPESAPEASKDGSSVPDMGSGSGPYTDPASRENPSSNNQNAADVVSRPASAVAGNPNTAMNLEAAQSLPQNVGQGEDQVSGSQAPSVTTGGYIIHAAPNGGIVIDGMTLDSATPVTTANNVQISLDNAGIVVGGNRIAVPPPHSGETSPAIAIGGHTLQISNSPSGTQVIVDGHALPPGTTQASVGSHIVSMKNPSELYILPTMLPYVPLPNPITSPTTKAPTNEALIPFLLPDNLVSIAGRILTAGGPAATISGTRVSLLPDNVGVLIDQKTVHPIPTPAPELGLVVEGTTLTPIAGGSGVAVDGTTLSKSGQSLVLGTGTVVSLRKGEVVVGSQTLGLPHSVQAITSLPSVQSQSSAKGTVQTLRNGEVVYEGATLSENGPAVTLSDGEVVSLERSRSVMSSSQAATMAGSAIESPSLPSPPIPATAEGMPTSNSASTATATAAPTSDDGILGMGAVHDGRSAGTCVMALRSWIFLPLMNMIMMVLTML